MVTTGTQCSKDIFFPILEFLSDIDSPTRRVGESFFDYEYLREFEAKIGTARKVV